MQQMHEENILIDVIICGVLTFVWCSLVVVPILVVVLKNILCNNSTY